VWTLEVPKARFFPSRSPGSELVHVPVLSVDSDNVHPWSAPPDLSAAIDVAGDDDEPTPSPRELFMWQLRGAVIDFLPRGARPRGQFAFNDPNQSLLDLAKPPLELSRPRSLPIPGGRSPLSARWNLPAGQVAVEISAKDDAFQLYGFQSSNERHVPTLLQRPLAHTVVYKANFNDAALDGGLLKLKLATRSRQSAVRTIVIKASEGVARTVILRVSSFCSTKRCLAPGDSASDSFIASLAQAFRQSGQDRKVGQLNEQFRRDSEVLEDFAAHFAVVGRLPAAGLLLPVIAPALGFQDADPSVRCKETMGKI
jgi:hypothetical protein